MWFVSITFGVLSVVLGILILRFELNSAIRAIPGKNDLDNEGIRRELDELNSSFFDIANDLEGKYSIHEKQIRDMEHILEEYTKKQMERRRSAKPKQQSPKPPVRGGDPETKDVEERESTDELLHISEEKMLMGEARRLSEEGYSASEVAKILGIGISELRLMLGMKK